MIDSVARFIPGVLGNADSPHEESFAGGLLEAPQFTRPRSAANQEVPDVLLSGDHKKIEEWRGKIDAKLEAAQVILVLISPSFIASDYCWDVEAQRAMKRHALGEACVIPVIVRPCEWRETPFAELQALPKNGKPIVLWEHRDQAWLEVAR